MHVVQNGRGEKVFSSGTRNLMIDGLFLLENNNHSRLFFFKKLKNFKQIFYLKTTTLTCINKKKMLIRLDTTKLLFYFQNSTETVDEKINEIPGEQVHGISLHQNLF